MYKQLTSWLLHGLLYKNGKNNKTEDEFFIHYKGSEKVEPNEDVKDDAKVGGMVGVALLYYVYI